MDCLGTVFSTVLAKCPQTKHPRLLILLVPSIEGLLSLRLVLEDTQQVSVAEGIDGLLSSLGLHPVSICVDFQNISIFHNYNLQVTQFT